MKILLFEDNEPINKQLEIELKKRDYEVISKVTLNSAIDWLNEENIPQLALLDIVDDRSRPSMKNKANSGGEEAGFHLANMLKNINETLPIIFFSAYGGEREILKDIEKYGPIEFFDKGGYNSDKLGESVIQKILKKITKVFEKQRMQQKWEEYWSDVPFGKIAISQERELKLIKEWNENEKPTKVNRTVKRKYTKEIDEITRVDNVLSYDRDFDEVDIKKQIGKVLSKQTLIGLLGELDHRLKKLDLIVVLKKDQSFFEIKKGVHEILKLCFSRLKNELFKEKYLLTLPDKNELYTDFEKWINYSDLKKISSKLPKWIKDNHGDSSATKQLLSLMNLSSEENLNLVKKVYEFFKNELIKLCTEENRINETTIAKDFEESVVRGNDKKVFQMNISSEKIRYFYPIPRQSLLVKFYNDKSCYYINYVNISSFEQQMDLYYSKSNRLSPFLLASRGVLVNGNYLEYIDTWEYEGKEYYSVGLKTEQSDNKEDGPNILDINIQNAGYNRVKGTFPTLRTEKNPNNL